MIDRHFWSLLRRASVRNSWFQPHSASLRRYAGGPFGPAGNSYYVKITRPERRRMSSLCRPGKSRLSCTAPCFRPDCCARRAICLHEPVSRRPAFAGSALGVRRAKAALVPALPAQPRIDDQNHLPDLLVRVENPVRLCGVRKGKGPLYAGTNRSGREMRPHLSHPVLGDPAFRGRSVTRRIMAGA